MTDQDLTDLQFFEIPHMRQLTTEQNLGAACVWCAQPLPPTTGINLHAGIGWAPHSCPTCYPIRTAVVTTYRDLHTHWTTCEPCEDAALTGDPLCPTATPQQTALLQARTAAHKPPPTCLSCHDPIAHHEMHTGTFVPLIWMGYSSPHRSFLHTGPRMWHGTTL
ncbi:hypothetical protein ACIQNU_21860 [Streptomyces sp. NPDC091292]|uniref:hypothetical protein n=1 Tax=Streptomyces sp. NPDC091292 TaxID=3365991 RepID=UPI00381BCFC5